MPAVLFSSSSLQPVRVCVHPFLLFFLFLLLFHYSHSSHQGFMQRNCSTTKSKAIRWKSTKEEKLQYHNINKKKLFWKCSLFIVLFILIVHEYNFHSPRTNHQVYFNSKRINLQIKHISELKSALSCRLGTCGTLRISLASY